jgi:hypothetical protein
MSSARAARLDNALHPQPAAQQRRHLPAPRARCNDQADANELNYAAGGREAW